MSESGTVGGYRRPATAAASVRLDLNEAPLPRGLTLARRAGGKER